MCMYECSSKSVFTFEYLKIILITLECLQLSFIVFAIFNLYCFRLHTVNHIITLSCHLHKLSSSFY